MKSLKRIWLFLIVASIASVFVLVVVVVAHSGNPAVGPERKVRVLRRKDQLQSKPTQKEIAVANGQDKEERSLENKIPKHLPIKIKIKADKEKQFKDLDNDKWASDLEIEVTNTGTKPIYGLTFLLLLPENIINAGRQLFSIHFGRIEFSMYRDTLEIAKPEDVSIKPGETSVFKIPYGQSKGWELLRTRNGFPQPRKIVLEVEQISFGDGTGFRGIEGTAWPPDKKVSINRCRPEAIKSFAKTHHSKSKNDVAAVAVDCCPSGCNWLQQYDSETACYATIGCTQIHRADLKPCTESGACGTVEWKTRTCIVNESGYSYEHECPYAVVTSCASSPLSGGGGGGSGGGGTMGGNPGGCDEYYWLWYVFNGSDWEPLGPIDYAGCW